MGLINAGMNISTGFGNIFMGTESGKCVTTGNRNVAIGYGASVTTGTANEQLAIGIGATNWLRGDSSFNIYDKDGNQLNGASGWWRR